MRKTLSLSLALAGIAAVAACGGGGSAGGGSASLVPPGSPGNHAPNAVTFSIKLPSAPAAPAARKPGYVSPATQSIGVVVTNQGAAPSAAQYTNVTSCPQVSGVTTCTVTVQALPGNDSFAISTYSGTNGSGSLLSTGSIASVIVAGAANTTSTVTLGGVIASIVITPAIATLPLGQSTTLNVVAKDASGATIVGTFDNPIALSASNLALSKSSVTNSNDASQITAAWNYGVSGSASSTVTATGDGVTGTVPLTPGSGFAFYQTGTNSATDNGSVKMIAGPDGKLYYTSIGVVTCTNNFCTGQVGAVHQFDPATSTDTEVALQSSAIGLKFTSDGALWIGGGAPVNGLNYIYRMTPGSFSSAGVTPIPIPTPTRGTPNMRTFAQDGSGKVWFVDAAGSRYMSIPLAGPYTAASIVYYQFPGGPVGTPRYRGHARSINYVNGVLVAADTQNGSVDVISPSTGAVTGQFVSNMQASFGANASIDSANPYDSTDDGSKSYITFLGNWNEALPAGDLEAFNPATNTFTTIPTVNGPSQEQPTVPSVNGSLLYYADFALGAVGVTNLSNNTSRLMPVVQGNYFTSPGGMAAMPDGTAWFPCYGSAPTFHPLCVGHTVYFNGWSVWPSSSITLYGAGANSAQLVGIMEAPNTSSAPFTVTSGNTSVCTITSPTSADDHNFSIIGAGAGACTVTVKDKNNVSQSISVTVTTTSGTVQARQIGGK